MGGAKNHGQENCPERGDLANRRATTSSGSMATGATGAYGIMASCGNSLWQPPILGF